MFNVNVLGFNMLYIIFLYIKLSRQCNRVSASAAHKTEFMCFNQTDISALNGSSLKLVDKFTYLGSIVSSTETDIDTRLTTPWTAINRLLAIWKSDLTDKMIHSFFQAAIVSILLYGCTTENTYDTKRYEWGNPLHSNSLVKFCSSASWVSHLYGLMLHMFSDKSDKLETYTYVRTK